MLYKTFTFSLNGQHETLMAIDHQNVFECPFCGVKQPPSLHGGVKVVSIAIESVKTPGTPAGNLSQTPIKWLYIVRGNCIDCKEEYVEGGIYFKPPNNNQEKGSVVKSWSLVPTTVNVKKFPTAFVPQHIQDQYSNAKQIVNINKNASAALSRRGIQEIIRVLYGITKPTLYAEIDELHRLGVLDVITRDALHRCREMGNVGCHPSQEPGIIVDVSMEEANKLLSMCEFLMTDYSRKEQTKKELSVLAAEYNKL